MKKIGILVGVIVVVAGVGAYFALKGRHPPIPSKRIKTVVLVTLDTLRADHLGFMGYPRNTSPFLDKLSRESLLFKNAFTVIPWTIPSHASIFTSHYPMDHYSHQNAQPLDPSLTIMPEYFKRMGYQTAAFVSANFFSRLKFERGFDHFLFPPSLSASSEKVEGNRPLKCPADRTVDAAIDWLKSQPANKPLFLWIHLFDTHLPYQEGVTYQSSEDETLKDTEQLITYWTEKQGIRAEFFTNKGKMVEMIDSYDGEIQFMDSQLKRLYEFMGERQSGEDSLWIITQDHGEGLGSHLFYGHHFKLYNEQLRAPIILHNPKSKKGKVVEDLVENIDILPTVADLVGFPLDTGLPARRGKSLLSRQREDSYVFSVKSGGIPETSKVFRVVTPSAAGAAVMTPTELYAVQNNRYKYIYAVPLEDGSPDVGDEFYDLAKDSLELNNLVATPSEVKDNMKNRLIEFISANPRPGSSPAVDDKQLEESLRALGY